MADFVVELSGGPVDYQLSVDCAAGSDVGAVHLDLDLVRDTVAGLQATVLASAAHTRGAVPELERTARALGHQLFRAVFRDTAGMLYFAARQHAEEHGEALRMVLRLRAAELAALPWELLYEEEMGGYLSLRQPVVRHPEVLEAVQPLRVTAPLRILGMTALPGGRAMLDAATERANLQAALQPLIDRNAVELSWVEGETWQALQDRLYERWHVFHFIGHGGFDAHRGEGLVAFADERGNEQRTRATDLARLLDTARPRLQLVVLNTCQSGTGDALDLFSSTAAVLVRTIPAVVAMQFEVTDQAANVFARAFYRALAHNRPVDESVRVGRIAMSLHKQDTLEWVTPVLYLRSTDAHLFDLVGVPDAEQQAATLEAARLEEARAEAARLEEARLEEARLEAARAEAARLEEARLEEARLEAARAEAARAEEARRAAARRQAEREEAARGEAADQRTEPQEAVRRPDASRGVAEPFLARHEAYRAQAAAEDAAQRNQADRAWAAAQEQARRAAAGQRRRRLLGWAAAGAALLVAAVVGAVFAVGGGGDDGAADDGGSPATSVAYDVVVPGTVVWFDTGVDVAAGDSLSIEATGTVRHNRADPASEVGPDGADDDELVDIVLNEPGRGVYVNPPGHGGLVGKLGAGGKVVGVGSGFSLDDAPTGGRLYLGINDYNGGNVEAGVANNGGSYEVTVTLSRR